MPQFKVQAPDGMIIKIEAADEATAIRGAKEHYASKRSQPPKKDSLLTKATGAMANLNRGLGIGDEIAGAVQGAVNYAQGVPNALQAGMAQQRATEDRFQETNPHSAAFMRGVGNAPLAALPVGTAATGARVANALRGAVTAGVTGAGYAAADRGDAGERLVAANKASRDPVALALGAGGGALAPATAKVKLPKAPSLDQMRGARDVAYKAVEDAGVAYEPKAIGALLDHIGEKAARSNINANRHPKAWSMLDTLDSLVAPVAPANGGAGAQVPVSMIDLDQMRQVIRRDLIKSGDEAEGHFGKLMIKAIDDFMDNAGGPEVVGGGSGAGDLIRNARQANTRFRKLEAVEDATEAARLRAGSTYSGGNINNASRQELRKVYEKTGNWTDEEKAALESVIIGTRAQNALRQVGKLAPQGNGIMLMSGLATTAAGGMTGGTTGAALGALPALVGAVSKVAADKMTSRRIDELSRVIASGKGGQAQIAARQELDKIVRAEVIQLRKRFAGIAANGAGVATASAAAAREPREQ